jgi:hypothetical protein
MILLLLLLSACSSCSSPTASATDLGNVQTLTSAHLEAHLGSHVTIQGTPTPTAVVQSGDCRVYYLIGNRSVLIDDCTPPTDTVPTTFTGRLDRFSSLPSSTEIRAFYLDRFDIKLPGTAYVVRITTPR